MNAQQDRQQPSAHEYVQAIMRREGEEAAIAAAQRPRTRRPTLLLALLPALVGLIVLNVTLIVRQPPVFSAEEEDAAARFAIYLTASAIEDYRAATGRLPANLTILGLDEDGVAYEPAASGYALKAVAPDRTIVYRSGQDLRPFAEAWNVFEKGNRL